MKKWRQTKGNEIKLVRYVIYSAFGTGIYRMCKECSFRDYGKIIKKFNASCWDDAYSFYTKYYYKEDVN